MEHVEFGNKFKAACDGCRRQKVKCDRSTPKCSVCRRRGIECVWPKSPQRQSELKRFYDYASSNIHMFKCVKEMSSAIKKPCRVKSKANGLLSAKNPKLPELTDDSGLESQDSSLSPGNLSSDNQINSDSFPLCSSLTAPRPSMETMVDDFDRFLIFDLTDKHGLGKTFIEGNSFISSCKPFLPNRNKKVRLLGLDYNPIFENTETDYAALTSMLEIHLINLFFNQVNTFFPLIHRGKFFKSLKSPSTKPSKFLLNAICFVACPFLPLYPMYYTGCHFKLSQIYHQEAMKDLEENIANPSIVALQAILLLYNGECALVEKLNAIQYKMIEQLSLDSLVFSQLSEEDREEVQNLFWCCYLQDKICNLTRCRKFAIPKSRFSLQLPRKLTLPIQTEQFPLPGAHFCQLAFIGSVKLAELIDDVQTNLSQYQHLPPQHLFALVGDYEKLFLDILSDLGSIFESQNQLTFSAMSLVIFRLYYHMAHIHIYLLVSSLLSPQFTNEKNRLQHKAMESACTITFLTESLHVDFFKFGPLLKVNSVLLAYTVHRIAIRFPEPLYENLGGFGRERAIITNLRNVNFRLGLDLSQEMIESLMVEFCTPPVANPLRVGKLI